MNPLISFTKYPPMCPVGTFWINPPITFTKYPAKYPVGIFWANSLISLAKCPPRYPMGICEVKTHGSFKKYPPICPMGILWKNPLSSFTKYPEIWLQCTQWVLYKVPTINSQRTHWVYGWVYCDHISGYFVKELGVLSQNVRGLLQPLLGCASHDQRYPSG